MKKTNEKGITLIALIVTIIVLLILASVSIAMLTGENGILTQAQKAKNETENAQLKEAEILTNYEQIINTSTGVKLENITGDEKINTVTQDSLGNRVVIPAGFKVVNPNDNVEDGIVIEDVSHVATAGSQFVWIPVGKNIKKKDGTTFDIKLSRYQFDDLGVPTDRGEDILNDMWQELSKGTGNTTAKENIESETEGFRGSAIKNGGYYIGRYEARDGTTEVERTSLTSDVNQITSIPDDYIYNYVNQLQAASLSQKMYDDINFTSDLMNSYAWDTTTVFLQNCDNRIDKTIPYSKQISLNIGSIAPEGTNNLDMEDVICNVFDIASNCREYTTETNILETNICVLRGGSFNTKDFGVRNRINARIGNDGDIVISFRPILYL